MSTGGFGDTAADRIAGREELVVLHVLPIFSGDRHFHEHPLVAGRAASADCVFDVGRGPWEAIDAVHGPPRGDLLLVGLLILAPPGMRSMRPFETGPCRHGSSAVGILYIVPADLGGAPNA